MELNPPSWLRQQLKNKWSATFFKVFIFTLPLQKSILIYETLWGRGFSNPYISISFSISEAFLLIATFLFFCENYDREFRLGKKTLFLSFILVLSMAALSLLLSPFQDPSLKFFLAIQLLELLLIHLLIINKVLKVNEIFKVFTFSMSLQALLAFLQLMLGHSLGLGILGETPLTSQTPHIAKLDLGFGELIRSYGTFGHPNILGGFLVISILGTLLYPPKSTGFRNLCLAVQFLGLICSFSRSALLALILGILLLTYRSVPLIKEKYNRFLSYGVFVLIGVELLVLMLTRPLPLLSDPAVQARIEGYEVAGEIFTRHPLGVGWNLETLFLDEDSSKVWFPWDYEPTHNIFLLIWTELGIQGLLAFLFLLFACAQKLLEHKKILGTDHEENKKNFFFSMGLALLCTGFFDHYWLTSEQGLFLAVILFSTISRFLSDPVPMKPIKRIHSKEVATQPGKPQIKS